MQPASGATAHQAYSAVVSRIGTGPWGAGVWYGDSQHSFLTVPSNSRVLGQPLGLRAWLGHGSGYKVPKSGYRGPK